MNTLTCVG